LRIFAARAVLPTGIKPAVIEIFDGKILSILVDDHALTAKSSADLIIESGYLAPGLIDLQINGAFGTDFMAAQAADWKLILSKLPATGVTAIYPTVITAPIAELSDWFNKNRKYLATEPAQTAVLGFHLEGPFLSAARRGAHRLEHVIEPTDADVSKLIAAGKDSLKIVTLAPELAGAGEAIKKFIAAGIKVSVGHSDADAQTVAMAADLGASLITHLFNAQSPVSHRNTGVAGQALIDARLTLGLIVDLHHVAAQSVLLAFKAAQSRVCLVTDAISALGMPNGTYELAGEEVLLTEGNAPMRHDGTLAGSALRLDHAISNCINLGIDPHLAICAATKVPATAMGLTDRGQLILGQRADLVWLDSTADTLEARTTWIAGEQVYSK
jgi:N-acetylglucosamine-6-phosphate deacetylase